VLAAGVRRHPCVPQEARGGRQLRHPRIREALADVGRPAPEPAGVIDSLNVPANEFGRRAGDLEMATLASYFGIGKQKHRSLDDARMNLKPRVQPSSSPARYYTSSFQEKRRPHVADQAAVCTLRSSDDDDHPKDQQWRPLQEG
jgi:hypothetical protein